MIKSDNIYNVSFAKLEAKVETMSEKLNKLDEIDDTLKEIQKCLNTNHTDVALLKKDVDTIGEKQRVLEVRVIENEKKLNSLTIRVTAIVSVISFLGWFISNLLMK